MPLRWPPPPSSPRFTATPSCAPSTPSTHSTASPQHKGYATPEHRRALTEYGPTPLHRKSFSPVRATVRLSDPNAPTDFDEIPEMEELLFEAEDLEAGEAWL